MHLTYLNTEGKAIALHYSKWNAYCLNILKQNENLGLSLHFKPSLQSAFCTSSAFWTQSVICSLHFILTDYDSSNNH